MARAQARSAQAPPQRAAQAAAPRSPRSPRRSETQADPPAPARSEQRSVQSVEVGGRLLLALAAHRMPMPLKDLAAAAGLSAARAHPYLVSYGRLGLIEQERSGSGRYALGPAALQVGLASLSQLDPLRVAEPVAEDLATSTGFAVALALWGNQGPTIVRMFEARQPLLVAMRAGTVMSVLGTATGRAFAGALREEAIALASAAGALGDHPGRAATLSREQREIVRLARADLQAHGLVRAEGRPIPGVNAFSAPALDSRGEPAIVITALGHQDHFTVHWNSPLAAAVRAASQEISRRLGWPGDEAPYRS